MAALALGAHLYYRADDETRRFAEQRLQQMLGPLNVTVGSARYTPGGVTLRDLSVYRRLPNGDVGCALKLGECRLAGRLDVASLVRGHSSIGRVTLTDAQLLLKRDRSGRWGFEGLRLPAGDGRPAPKIEIHNATLLIDDPAIRSEPLAVTGINAEVEPMTDSPGWYEFRAESSGKLARRLAVAGQVRAADGAARMRVLTQDLQIDDTLVASLATLGVRPPAVRLAGSISVDGRVTRDPGKPLDWNATLQLAGARVASDRFEGPVEQLTANARADRHGLSVTDATAVWRGARLQLAATRNGWRTTAPVSLRMRVAGLPVTPEPPRGLPEKAARLWRRFKPQGRADAELEATFDGLRLTPRATITFKDAAFEDSEKFPYRLTGGRGAVLVNGGVGAVEPSPDQRGGHHIAADVTAVVEDTRAKIVASLSGVGRPSAGAPSAMPPGTISITADGVPITPQLVAALPDAKAREVIRQLRPRGRVDMRWQADRADASGARIETQTDVRLAGCGVNYEGFPYDLAGVTGWIRARGKTWRFEELESRASDGRLLVAGHGGVQPTSRGSRLSLTLRGQGVPLEERLRAALPSDAQAAWQYLLPRGRLNFDALVTHDTGDEKPRVQISMTPDERSVAIEPAFSTAGYRYRLEQLDGRFDWRDNRLDMTDARAVHGRTAYGCDGVWETDPSGAWRLALERLRADRLAFNHDFLLAAPPGLRAVIAQLEPRGGVDLSDSTLDVYSPAPGAAVQARWKLALACHQVALTAGVPLEALSGVVRLEGGSDGANAATGGTLDLDSVVWNDLMLTAVNGPLHCDDVECVLGEGVAIKTGGESRRVTARAYGGDVTLNSLVQYGGRPRYGLQMDLANVDVSRVASEWLERPEAVGGRLRGRLEFQGVGASIYGLDGRGDLAIEDADLYELPLLVRLLKVLRNRAPDASAFDVCEASFTQQGKQLEFQRLNLLGDAVSFYGRGRANLDRQLDLEFHTIVGRNELAAPALRSLLGQASQQLLQLKVGGTLDAPEIRREALPIVGDMIEQLQAGWARPLEPSEATGATTPATLPEPRSAARGRTPR
ncbi:MAG: AsmA-like C-terminal region-containing protein [Planctomycetota bacterium]